MTRPTLSVPHKKRLVTGAGLTLLLASCLAYGGLPLRLLVCAASLAALWELFQMFWPGRGNILGKAVGLMGGGVITLGSGWYFDLGGAALVLGLTAFFAALRFTCRYGRGGAAALTEDLPLVFGLLYIPLALQFALHMSASEQAFAVLGAVASDIGAYYAGSSLGRHKICPQISPNKSWEGFAGGIGGSALALALGGLLAAPAGLEALSLWQWALAGAIFSLLAQAGDFFESALKRSAGVKDSSSILPGHGGVLDRLDSIIPTLPAAYAFFYLFR